MNNKTRLKGMFLVIIGATLWGISGTAAQYLFQKKGFTAEWLVVARMLASGIILTLYSFIKGNKNIIKIWTNKKDVFSLIIFSILGMLGVQYTYFASINYGNAATATILQYLSPVIITCYLAIKSKKFPHFQQLLAIILAMIGTFFIITKGDMNNLSISKLALFWGIASAFASALYTLQPISLLKKYDSTTVIGLGMLLGGISFSFIHNPLNFSGEISLDSIIAIAFVIIFGTLIAFYCYLESLKYIQPTEASILGSLEPLSAAFLSIIWLNVSFAPLQWIGTIFIISTVIILSYSKKEKVLT